MKSHQLQCVLCIATATILGLTATAAEKSFTDHFSVPAEDWTSTGGNEFFRLEPGHVLVLEVKEDRKLTSLTITVLNETRQVDGVETRVIEERETVDGQPIEVSRNFFAASKKTGDVYYFGEEVDTYTDGKVTGHGGAWLSGVNGAKFGLMMPAKPRVGDRYYQELAGKVAQDRAEVLGLGETLKTPAGELTGCVKTEETTPLEKDTKEYKFYAPGIGLVKDGKLLLVRHSKSAN